jgi:hypothetical protein
MVDNKSFAWGGEGFVTNSTDQTTGHVNTACCVIDDTHTLNFTLLATDLYTDGTSNRSEAAFSGRYAAGVTLNMSYEMWLSGSSSVNDDFGSGKWCVIGQLHDSGGSSPPMEINLGGDANNVGTIGDQLCVDIYDGSIFSQKYRDSSGNLTRGSYHTFDIIIKAHATAGILQMWIDGTQVVNYSGALFETAPYYWKFGMYRGPTPGEDQTQNYKIRNFLCVRT